MALYASFVRPVDRPRALVRRDRPGQLEALTALVARVDPRLTVRATLLTDRRGQELALNRLGALLAALLGVLGLAIAVVGIAGMFGFIARQRTREIGIRIALGGRPARVIRAEFGPHVRALSIGVGLGLVAASIIAPLLRGWVHPDIGGFDVVTFGSVAAILTAAAIVATFRPLRQAVRLEPLQALRHD